MTWTCAPSGAIVTPQPSWLAFTGQTADEARAGGWTSVVHPDEIADALADWNDALTSGRPYASEHRLRRHDGEWRWMGVYAAPSYEPGGQVREWVGLNVDITDRRQAEQERRHFAALIEQSTDAIGFASLNGTALYVNHATSDLLGLTGALQQLTMTDLTADDDRRMLAEEVVPRVLGGGVWKGQLRIRHAVTGETIPMEQVVFPLVNAETGAIEYIATIARDIRDRVEADRLVRASEARFQRASEAVSGFIYELSLDTWQLTATRGIEWLLGLSSTEPITYGDWLERIHPDDRARVRDEWTRAWQSRPAADAAGPESGRSFRTEYRVRDRQGAYVDVWDHAVFERDETGRAIRAIGHIIDISDRRRAEDALRQADQKKNEFLAVLAHELRNPLAPIRNGLQVMQLAAGNPAVVEQARTIVSRQVDQMTHLIDELMDVSRISQGRITVHRQRMRLADALRNAVDSARPLIEANGHHFIEHQPAEPIWVDGDLLRLSQVFTNILSNAAKYTPRGGEIALTVTRERGDVLVSIDDNGIGIPADKLSDVFEMFVQVDRSHAVSRSGLGLGLHIARRLVLKHGGNITVESGGARQGSRFTVRLPMLPTPTPATRPRPALTPPRQRLFRPAPAIASSSSTTASIRRRRSPRCWS